MLKHLAFAGALSCALAAGLSACTTVKSAETIASADVAAGAGVAKALSVSLLNGAKAAAVSYCGTKPDTGTIAALYGAISGKPSAADLGQLACDAYSVATAFTAETGAPAPPSRSPLKGELVETTAVVNGRPIKVRGTVEDPRRAAASGVRTR